MIRTIEATIEEDGTVRLAEAVKPGRRSRALLTILDEDPLVDEVTLLSETGLQDWLRPEEDEAWAHLQEPRS